MARLGGASGALARQLYRAYLDWDARDALGIAPAQAIVDRVRSVDSLDALTALICEVRGLTTFLELGTSSGLNDPGTYIARIDTMKLLLNDSAEYRSLTDQGKSLRAMFRMVAARQFTRFGYSEDEAEAMLERALSLEADLAGSMMTVAERLSPDYPRRINHEMSRDEAAALCRAFPLLTFADSRGYARAKRFLVCEPEYLKKLDAIYREDRLEDLKNYLIVRFIKDSMLRLDRQSAEIVDEAKRMMYGIEGSREDEKAACAVVREMLPTPMARAFLAKYDASEMKSRITRLCGEAIDGYRALLAQEDWLTDETRRKAIEKLDGMTVRAVYPDRWRDYSGLSLAGLGYFDCMSAIDWDDWIYAGSLADQPVDPGLWYCGRGQNHYYNDILTYNAYYDPSTNSITILRGILGGSLYRDGMSDAALYGGIGYIIGHEISHAFDTTGAQFDARGRLKDWWQPEDYAAFSKRAEKVAAAFDRMTVFDGYSVPGESVQDEAIADMAGLKCMLTLLEQSGSADYRSFFEAFAGFFCRILIPETVPYWLAQDSHPPNYLRCNTVVQQFPQFFEAYGVREGDGMYLAPEDNFMVWFRGKADRPLRILRQPRDVTVREGGTAHFLVEAEGAASYQWWAGDPDTGREAPLSDGESVSGAHTALLTLNHVRLSWDGRQTWCVITDRAGNAVNAAERRGGPRANADPEGNTVVSDRATLTVLRQGASGPVDTGDHSRLPLCLLIALLALVGLWWTRRARR